jgi:hypothetical protein
MYLKDITNKLLKNRIDSQQKAPCLISKITTFYFECKVKTIYSLPQFNNVNKL